MDFYLHRPMGKDRVFLIGFAKSLKWPFASYEKPVNQKVQSPLQRSGPHRPVFAVKGSSPRLPAAPGKSLHRDREEKARSEGRSPPGRSPLPAEAHSLFGRHQRGHWRQLNTRTAPFDHPLQNGRHGFRPGLTDHQNLALLRRLEGRSVQIAADHGGGLALGIQRAKDRGMGQTLALRDLIGSTKPKVIGHDPAPLRLENGDGLRGKGPVFLQPAGGGVQHGHGLRQGQRQRLKGKAPISIITSCPAAR